MTKEEEEKYSEFSDYYKKEVIIKLLDGEKIQGKLVDIESPYDVEPEYPLFIIRKKSG